MAVLEEFANRCPVANLAETFSEIRQVTHATHNSNKTHQHAAHILTHTRISVCSSSPFCSPTSKRPENRSPRLLSRLTSPCRTFGSGSTRTSPHRSSSSGWTSLSSSPCCVLAAVCGVSTGLQCRYKELGLMAKAPAHLPKLKKKQIDAIVKKLQKEVK